MSTEEIVSSARLRWQCRRGMLELDLLLEEFLDRGYETLSPARQKSFQVLLTYPDQLLYDYLMGDLLPSDPDIADVVRSIRGAAIS